IMNHLGNALHDLVAAEDLGARLHEFGDAPAVACALHDEVRAEGNGFGMVELVAALQASARNMGCHGDKQLVLLAWCQVHAVRGPFLVRLLTSSRCAAWRARQAPRRPE